MKLEPEPISERSAAILERRRERLRQPLPADEEHEQIFVAEFPVGHDRHAIRLEELRGSLPLSMVTPVPLANPEVVGLVSFRGELLTVYSFAALLGISGWRTDPAVLLILEPDSGGRLAVDCEEPPRASAIALSQFRTARERDAGPIVDLVSADGGPTRLIVDIRAIVRAGARRK